MFVEDNLVGSRMLDVLLRDESAIASDKNKGDFACLENEAQVSAARSEKR